MATAMAKDSDSWSECIITNSQFSISGLIHLWSRSQDLGKVEIDTVNIAHDNEITERLISWETVTKSHKTTISHLFLLSCLLCPGEFSCTGGVVLPVCVLCSPSSPWGIGTMDGENDGEVTKLLLLTSDKLNRSSWNTYENKAGLTLSKVLKVIFWAFPHIQIYEEMFALPGF